MTRSQAQEDAVHKAGRVSGARRSAAARRRLDADLQEAARETGRLKKVEDAQRKCEEGAEALEQLRKARNKAIRDACEKGATHAQVAAITGLGRARIGQIALGAGGR